MLMAIANWIYSTFFSCHRVASSEATHLSSTTHTHREKSAALARLRSTIRLRQFRIDPLAKLLHLGSDCLTLVLGLETSPMSHRAMRLERLLREAREMVDAVSEYGQIGILDPPRFQSFRAAALLALRESLGEQHPYYIEFERKVFNSGRDPLVAAMSLLQKALDDVKSGVSPAEALDVPFRELLHPVVKKNAYDRFRNGHYRDAILNSVIAVFDLLRQRTGLTMDGDSLATRAFSVGCPVLIVGDLASPSGRNEQRGVMQMFQGAWAAIRNPTAHTMHHTSTRKVAAQYLVFASVLAHYIDEAEKREV